MGMSTSQKRVEYDFGTAGGNADQKRLGVMGDGVVVHKERKKPFPFREEAKHAK